MERGRSCLYLGSIIISSEINLIVVMVRLVKLLRRVWVTIHARKDLVGCKDRSSGLGLVDLLSACHDDGCLSLGRVVLLL